MTLQHFRGNAVVTELRFQHNKQHGSLTPLGIGNANGRRFLYGIVHADGVFQIKRRHPFAAGFNDILEPVRNLDVSVLIHVTDVSRMQPPAAPEVFRLLRILVVPFGKPRRADNDFAGGFAVIRLKISVPVGNPDIDKRDGHSRLDGDVAFLFVVEIFHVRLQIGHADDRAGFGHSIAGHDGNPQIDGRDGNSLGQTGAADDHLPGGKIKLFRDGADDDHLKDCGHAMGKSDLFPSDQFHQHFRLVFAWINLLDAHHRRDKGEAPGMNMEHGRDRHVDIRRGETQRSVVAAHADADTHGVKNDLAMGEINPFGKAGCPRCVERGGLCVFVKIGKFEIRRSSGQKLLVFRVIRGIGFRRLIAV